MTKQDLHQLEDDERKALSIALESLKYYWEQAREYADGESDDAALAHGAIRNLAQELDLIDLRFWKRG